MPQSMRECQRTTRDSRCSPSSLASQDQTDHLVQQQSFSPTESSYWPQDITSYVGGGWKKCPVLSHLALHLSFSQIRMWVAQAGLEHYIVEDNLEHFFLLTLPQSDLLFFVASCFQHKHVNHFRHIYLNYPPLQLEAQKWVIITYIL